MRLVEVIIIHLHGGLIQLLTWETDINDVEMFLTTATCVFLIHVPIKTHDFENVNVFRRHLYRFIILWI